MWDLVAAALPGLLPPAVLQPPQRLADLIALGADVAEVIRPGGTIPGLTQLANRASAARSVVESRRLLKILDAGPPR